MTQNNLFLNRLIIVTLSGKVAYDETFHSGVNIIAGDNSSGKSTITHFIFYVLGGAFNDWVKEAKKCSFVIAEVVINGAVLTFKREINISPKTNKANAVEPMFIFWGNYNDSQLQINSTNWQKYNFSVSDNKKSFSNIIFDILGIPIVKGDNNITFHQLLRLIYVDQESPTNSLFLYEQFDSTLTRETVADLLLGVYNQDLYDNYQRKVIIERELDETKGEIRIIKKFISNPMDLNPSHIQTRIDNKQKEIIQLEDEIIKLKQQTKSVKYTNNTKLEFETLQLDAINQRKKVLSIENKINSIKNEIDDTSFFIETLTNKIKAIRNSILTREFLEGFPLEYCPECLSPISPSDIVSTCKLCKEHIDKSYGVTQAKKIEQEIGFQIKESTSIIKKLERELINLQASYTSEKEVLHSLQKQVNSALNDVKSVRDERIDTLYKDKGFFEGEIMQLRTIKENAVVYHELVQKQIKLEQELKVLKDTIEIMEFKQNKLKHEISQKVEEKGVLLLNNDLQRQDEFIHARTFFIDYRNNLAFIKDKEARYSASSNFYLKVAARFSLFLASLEIAGMRYPRFIFCDNMEDKGIEEGRAQNFQKLLIVEAEKHTNVQFQMIYTTSYISDELKGSPYCVGQYYTKDNPSLKNVNE